MVRVFSLFVLCFSLAHCALDNSGTEFVLSYMENTINTINYEIELFITTLSNNVVEVNITTPLFDSGWLTQVNATRGNIVQVNVPATIRGLGTALESKGVLIQAMEEVTVYCVNKQKFSTDGFIAYPVDTLGTEYVAVTWDAKPVIMVAAVTDGTSVTFAIPSTYSSSFDYDGNTYNGGTNLTVSLNRMQTFHLYSDYGDLTGTTLSGNQAFVAFSGNKKTAVEDTNTGTSSDHLVEQLVPTQSWGTEFITFPTPERTVGDYIRVLAAEDNTNFTFEGSSYILNAAQYTTFNKPSGSYFYVTSDKGICIAIFCKTEGKSGYNDAVNGGDPAMSFSVPVALYGSDYTWSTVTATTGDFNNYIVVVSNLNYISGLVLNDVAVSATWVNVTGTSDFVATYMNVTPGAHSLYNSVPANGFLGMAMGNAQFNSYGYASGLRLAHINLPCTTSSTTAGDGYDNDCDGRIDEETDDGADNDGDGLIDEDLALYPRVNGNYTEWTSWGACSATCGSNAGTYVRTRTCTNPAPANNGLDCVGEASETAACTGPSDNCPIDGNWGSWGNWSTCSVTCASGVLSRNRTCDNPPPQYNGTDCVGNDTETTPCTISEYCLPSYYGNLVLNCTNGTEFGCGTGSMKCIDIGFRCDGTRDCDDGTDESVYFTGCAESACKSGTNFLLPTYLIVLLLPVLITFLKLEPKG